MDSFNHYLAKNKDEDIGIVDQIVGPVIYATGLNSISPHELVIFEDGKLGQVFSLTKSYVEIIIFSKHSIKVGTKIARTKEFLEVPVGQELLGKVINPFGKSLEKDKVIDKTTEKRQIDTHSSDIINRKTIKKSLSTGISIVDLLIPLGKGQRELVIGDRKTGKTSFLYQTIIASAKQGDICIYAAIGKKKTDIKSAEELFIKKNVMKNVVIVATNSQDTPGAIYLTPYSAMTIAEYFKDKGNDVLIILDDLSTHAKFYREIALLGKRFPGRNSYPGDIFYTHARIIERAGNFITPKGEKAITCIPVIETTQGDLAGYVQTNLMSMTDGHLFFDTNLFYQGRRPAVNPFLSVTRVGKQTQGNLKRTVGRELMSFLNLYEKMQNFIHFGAELNDATKATLLTGNSILRFFTQSEEELLEQNIQILIFSLIWGQLLGEEGFEKIIKNKQKINSIYIKNSNFKKEIDAIIDSSENFNDLIGKIKTNPKSIFKYLT